MTRTKKCKGKTNSEVMPMMVPIGVAIALSTRQSAQLARM